MSYGPYDTGRYYSTVPAPKMSVFPNYELPISSFPITLWSIIWCAHKEITSMDDGDVEDVPVQH